jgi:hypothetical protein
VWFAIEADSVASIRSQMEGLVEGFPLAEAVVQAFSGWQGVLAIEALWLPEQEHQRSVRVLFGRFGLELSVTPGLPALLPDGSR